MIKTYDLYEDEMEMWSQAEYLVTEIIVLCAQESQNFMTPYEMGLLFYDPRHEMRSHFYDPPLTFIAPSPPKWVHSKM